MLHLVNLRNSQYPNDEQFSTQRKVVHWSLYFNGKPFNKLEESIASKKTYLVGTAESGY